MQWLLPLSLEKYATYPVAVAVSLGIFSVILLGFGYQPLASLETIVTGSFGTTYSASSTLVQTIPFLLCALAFLIAFKGRFYNIGVEGQMYLGALTGYLAASQLAWAPSGLAIVIVAFSGFLGGVLWLAVPLVMKIRLQVNELFPTLVLNFVAADLVGWLTSGPLKDPKAVNPQTPVVPQSTWLPTLVPGTELTVGIVIAVLAAFVAYFVLQKTVVGYEIRASGANPRAAKTGGVSIARSVAVVGLMSGGLAGLAGTIIVTTGNHYLLQNFSPGYGYWGIGVATLASFHPIGAIFASVLYSALWVGGETLQRLPGKSSVPIELIYVLQATIVLAFLLVQRFLSERRRWL